MFEEYVRHGWRLVPLVRGDKLTGQRGWNEQALTLDTVEDVQGVRQAGLAHAYSGTCAVDIDDIRHAVKEMRAHGIDLKALYQAPSAVRLLSGRPNKAKLLFALPEPLPSLKLIAEIDGKKKNYIDFRCGTKGGKTAQDALPPSIHPETKKPYYWEYGDDLTGHWSNLPPLPPELLEFWKARLTPDTPEKAAIDEPWEAADLAQYVNKLDPDMDYNDWLYVGMAIHHGTAGADEGLALWDEWSSTGTKYRGKADLLPHWRSFRGTGITVDYLFMQQVADPDVFDEVKPDKVAEAKEKARFEPVHVAEWVKRPPPKWLVRDVLPEGDTAMMFGASGSGKTFFAMDMAMAIASGYDWRDHPTETGPVLWIAAEAAGSVRNRALAYAKYNQIELEDSALWIIGDTLSLSDVNHVRALGEHAHRLKPRLVVVDTLAAAAGGANENSGEDMAVVLAACRALHKISGGLVMLIHHSGKDRDKGSRGWSGIKAAMETEIEVALEPTGDRIASITKQRDGEADAQYPFRLVPVSLDPFDNVPQTSCAIEILDGVQVATPELDGAWLSLAMLALAGHGSLTVQRSEYLETARGLAVKAGADEDLVEEYLDEALQMLAKGNRVVLSGSDITVLVRGEDG
ncbi:MAG: AAA family ATPase [Actinomycetota bacterium]